MQNQEKMVPEELLEEAETTYHQHFKPEVHFQHHLPLTLTYHDEEIPGVKTIKREKQRATPTILAEAYLAKHLHWDLTVTTNTTLTKFHELFELLKTIATTYTKTYTLTAGPFLRNELDTLRPYIHTITAPLHSLNKEAQKKIRTKPPLAEYVTMFSETKTNKGILITLGLGETLDDIPHLHRFIETHNLTHLTLLPLIPTHHLRHLEPPTSFYLTRWIAETRIKFPKIHITAGTWPTRVAEVGLFLKAGINALTQFPALHYYNTEAAKNIEEECKTHHRTLHGTLTDLTKLDTIITNVNHELQEPLTKYLQTLKGQR